MDNYQLGDLVYVKSAHKEGKILRITSISNRPPKYYVKFDDEDRAVVSSNDIVKTAVHEEVCDDNRFELIDKYRKKLFENTNISTSPDEMKVIDGILFRFWQMGWLDKLEKAENDVEERTQE